MSAENHVSGGPGDVLDVRVRGDVHESDSDGSVWLVEGSRVLVRTA